MSFLNRLRHSLAAGATALCVFVLLCAFSPGSVFAFDGKSVYDAAFTELYAKHYTLIDPAAAEAFKATWQNKYDQQSLDTETATDKAIQEMTWSLGQRFDYYFPPALTNEEREREDSTLAGIGLTIERQGLSKAIKALKIKDNKPTAEQLLQIKELSKFSEEFPLIAGDNPAEDSPAGKARIVKGDRIVAIDGVSVNGLTIDEAVAKIRGAVGTIVTLTIAHKDENGTQVTRDETIVRAKVVIHVVKTEYQGSVAHIRLLHFESQFGLAEMIKALEQAQNSASGIVLDLRNNPGGDMGQVLKMAQLFINEGVILKQVVREGERMLTITYSVTPKNFVIKIQGDDGRTIQTEVGQRLPLAVKANMPVLVLTNEYSASASEILAGALQVNNRARVIGLPSHGKGVGQRVVDLPMGRSMHITTFEFFPGGNKIDWIGIVPDVEVMMADDDDQSSDTSGAEPSTQADVQLNAAVQEIASVLAGKPTAARSQVEINARKTELEKTHKEAFQKEVQSRKEELISSENTVK